MLVVIEVIEGVLVLLDIIHQALGVCLRVVVFVEEFVIEQVIVFRFGKVVFVVHAGLLK
ncbi:hypothetical protein [Pseudomonas reidholzensis]|uniref:hypothetical protein n=1 Tax=Pseudomonas reidholzensis TaxID=1785162 RepID=UPI001ABF6C9E|nr:hypothetical protein [Pseudomonas reidholzensis]